MRIGFEGGDDVSSQSVEQGTAETEMSTIPTSYSGFVDKVSTIKNSDHRRSQSCNDVIPNEIKVQTGTQVARLNEQRQRSESIESVKSVRSI